MTCLKVRQIQLFYEITDRDKWNNHNRWGLGFEQGVCWVWSSISYALNRSNTLATLSVTGFEAFWNIDSEIRETSSLNILNTTRRTYGTVLSLLWRNSCVRLLRMLLCRIYKCFPYFRSAYNKFPRCHSTLRQSCLWRISCRLQHFTIFTL